MSSVQKIRVVISMTLRKVLSGGSKISRGVPKTSYERKPRLMRSQVKCLLSSGFRMQRRTKSFILRCLASSCSIQTCRELRWNVLVVLCGLSSSEEGSMGNCRLTAVCLLCLRLTASVFHTELSSRSSKAPSRLTTVGSSFSRVTFPLNTSSRTRVQSSLGGLGRHLLPLDLFEPVEAAAGQGGGSPPGRGGNSGSASGLAGIPKGCASPASPPSAEAAPRRLPHLGEPPASRTWARKSSFSPRSLACSAAKPSKRAWKVPPAERACPGSMRAGPLPLRSAA
mmetsp:Transcript_61069/g.189173  ORF Transcript_61069/g.189173 Transcript_61069/m.189173 type:complete len:282 (+) Transcript_61069:1540-2385(+)